MAEYSQELLIKVIETFADLASKRFQYSQIKSRTDSEETVEETGEITADKILEMEGDSVPFLWEPLFQHVGLVGLAGSSDTGKSTFLKQFSTAIVRGDKEFLGFPLNSIHRSVIYVSSEDDDHGVKSVLKRQKKKGSRKDSVKGLRFIFDTEKIYGKIKLSLSRKAADVVIMDAFSDLIHGDINASHIVRPYLDKFSNLAKQHKCLFIFLHHTTKKAEGKIPGKTNLSGSQSFEAKMRLVVEFRRDPIEPSIRHLCFVKGNYVGEDQKSLSYAMKFNENLTFEMTGERVSFEELSQTEDQATKKKERVELRARAIEMRKEGKTFHFIADDLGPNKTTIRRWCIDAGIENDEKDNQKIGPDEGLKSFLETFVKTEQKFKSVEDLFSKYEYDSKANKTKIRNRFAKHAKLKQKLTDEQFMKLLKDYNVVKECYHQTG